MLNNIQKRFILFIFCVISRLLFTYILSKTSNKLLLIIPLVISFGFIIIYFNGDRKKGLETFGDKIWWNNLRPFHFITHFLFFYLKNNSNYNNIHYILYFDIIIGIINFLNYHNMKNNFNKLFN